MAKQNPYFRGNLGHNQTGRGHLLLVSDFWVGQGKNIGGHGPSVPPFLNTTQSNYLLPWSLQLQFALSLWARFCISEKALTLAHCLRLAQSSSTSASTHKTQIVTELSIPSLQGPLGPQPNFRKAQWWWSSSREEDFQCLLYIPTYYLLLLLILNTCYTYTGDCYRKCQRRGFSSSSSASDSSKAPFWYIRSLVAM